MGGHGGGPPSANECNRAILCHDNGATTAASSWGCGDVARQPLLLEVLLLALRSRPAA